MPGHVKASTGPDPDPSPWLIVSEELKNQLKAKPYDAKKSCWVPNKDTGGYDEGLIKIANQSDKVTVKILETKEDRVFKKDNVYQVNPPKFDCCDDMSSLTYLNDACVLWNSLLRYKNELIYTYSGLFCIAINPYKRFPIYTKRCIEMYIGKRRNECPPHIFAVSEGSYQGMMQMGKNQSILITGESGAGKTENTKKVIAYFAHVGASEKKNDREIGLEEKVVNTNPVLEAWGNAKTVRNDNSSRFGKFIRIWFNQGGKLSGADMVVYLLEKSRLTYQAENERCFHSFYNIMSDQVPDIKSKCMLSNNIHDYWWVSQGAVKVDSIDDKEDMMFTDQAYNILGFSTEEKYNIYKLTAVVMHLGNLTKDFMPIGKEEQAEVRHEGNVKKAAKLCGVDPDWMSMYFCKPKLKVGAEWVSKGQTCAAAASSVAGIGRKIYELLFRYIVERCNETLRDPTMKKVQYIGCLDIAGFEIFDYNGFEQLCINFCNEKLQQFFNQHMFVLEQEEYVREGIEWTNVDFGMDLQHCIGMFEKPMGLLAILEEESLFPKATDITFANKLNDNLLGKHDTFLKAPPKPDPNAHFAVAHYAGVVSYNLTGWLEKNKDPVNDTIVELFKNGSNRLLVECFRDHPGQPLESRKDDSIGPRKKGAGKTVSGFYKSQLDDLMKTLYMTDPSFIRCVIPNTHKIPGGVEPALIMHQYRCNGVLAGIAICRKGFPNKMVYSDFKQRYNILAAAVVAKVKKDKDACKVVLDTCQLAKEKYRLGHTKVFFRAGILGYMEEVREERLSTVLSWLQAQARGKASRMVYKKMQDRKLALYSCQRTIRNYYVGKNWLWWQLWLAIKPKLKCTKFAHYKAKYEEKIAEAEANIGRAEKEYNIVSDMHEQLEKERNEIVLALQSGGSTVQEVVEKTNRLEAAKNDLQKQFDATRKKIADEESIKNGIEQQANKLSIEEEKLNGELVQLEQKIQSIEEDKIQRDDQIHTLRDEISHQEEIMQKLKKEKKSMWENKQKTEEETQALEDRCNHLSKIKVKLEQTLDEYEDSLECDRKSRSDSEKAKRRIEADLKFTQETLAELSRGRSELSQTIQRKDKELASIAAKIEDEQTLGGKYNKQIKEQQVRLEDLEDELDMERQSRAKAEKNKSTLARDIEELGAKLEEAGNSTTTQMELNKRREGELMKLKEELDETNIAHESTLAAMRQKHNNVMADMGEQIDMLNKLKVKLDSDKANMERDLQESRSTLEEVMRERANLDRNGKMTETAINDAHCKLDELARTLNETDAAKKKLHVEGQDLQRQIDEAELAIGALSKNKMSLTTQLSDTKRFADTEARDRSTLLSKFKNLNVELENLKHRIDEESEKKTDMARALSKAHAEAQLWKSKYETEGLSRIEELDSDRVKLNARIAEAEETIESLTVKTTSTEKIKHRLEGELEDLHLEYERVHAATAINEKRARSFDKVIIEWQAKVDDLNSEVEASQTECRNQNSELFRLKAAWDETIEQLEIVKRENKNLADEIKDLLDQLGDGGRSIHELEKQRRRLEAEKDELQTALEEAEVALEQEENKVLRAQLEVGQARQEIDRKMKEKEEEFENTRKNHQRAMDSMQASLEAETNAKLEALKIKKQLETDINELEITLDHANKANVETQKAIKRYHSQLRDFESAHLEESRLRQHLAERAANSERKAKTLESEMEEFRALMDSEERGRKQTDIELAESRAAVNDMVTINSKETADKRRIEGELHALHADIDDLMQQAKNSEEKSKKAMIDASRLADELKSEQDHTCTMERTKRSLENQIIELQNRLGEAEEIAAQGGRSMLAKLEARIRELEIELGSCQTKISEGTKSHHRTERRVRELEFQQAEDRKNQDSIAELARKLQGKIKMYKKQIEEAEEIAALNLAKFRKAQQEMEETEERCHLAESQLQESRYEYTINLT